MISHEVANLVEDVLGLRCCCKPDKASPYCPICSDRHAMKDALERMQREVISSEDFESLKEDLDTVKDDLTKAERRVTDLECALEDARVALRDVTAILPQGKAQALVCDVIEDLEKRLA